VSPINVSLIAEGPLDEQVLRQLITQTATHLQAGVCYGRSGREWLKNNLAKFNQAAHVWPYISLADLEQVECPPTLLQLWFPQGFHANLRPRIAVRMVESWLLADREALARYLGISAHHIPHQPEEEINPKQVMVNLARRSRYRVIKEDLVPTPHSSGHVGKNYRGQLEKFVVEEWQAERAQANSPSLQRAIRSIQQFRPVLPG
jgi:hypothetical protein